MRFSIREMLAFTFLVALALLAARICVDAMRDGERLTRLQNETMMLQIGLRTDQPSLHQALLHTQDEIESLRAMRERAIEHFPVILQKYSTIEPRGADVLSIRSIPTLRVADEPSPTIFRLLIPEARPVWLKFGIHLTKRGVSSSRSSETEDDLLTTSPFTETGPFEMQLPAGDLMLDVTIASVEEGRLPVVVTLNNEVLLHSEFVSGHVTGWGGGSIGAQTQLDFDRRQKVPWLVTYDMGLDTRQFQGDGSMDHAFSVWLSDHSSNFANFPRK
jgi:hypothetical protein